MKPQPEQAPPAAPSQVDGDVIGQVGARFQSSAARRQHAEPDFGEHPLPSPYRPERSAIAPESAQADSVRAERPDWDVDEADWDGLEQAFDLVRPYAWTRGRTACRHDLAIEALVSATHREPQPGASPEHQAILGLCQTPRSVAELAALLSVPLGVARVVLGDMADAGSVVVHRTAGSADGAPDFALMQRVLTCLQRL